MVDALGGGGDGAGGRLISAPLRISLSLSLSLSLPRSWRREGVAQRRAVRETDRERRRFVCVSAPRRVYVHGCVCARVCVSVCLCIGNFLCFGGSPSPLVRQSLSWVAAIAVANRRGRDNRVGTWPLPLSVCLCLWVCMRLVVLSPLSPPPPAPVSHRHSVLASVSRRPGMDGPGASPLPHWGGEGGDE